MNKLLNIYILKTFLSKFIFIMTAFIAVFFVVDIIDNIDKFIEHDISNNETIKYYLYTIPWFISLALPMTVLISTVFCFSILQKNHEVTALKASGISIFRISVPILICGILFSFISFFFDNLLVVNTLKKRALIEKKLKPNKKSNRTKSQNIYYHLDNAFLSIKKFNYKNNSGNNVSIQNYIGSDVIYRMDIKDMIWQGKNKQWNMKDIEIRDWRDNSYKYIFVKDTLMEIQDINPSIIKKDFINPEEMNYWELKEFIEKLENKGLSYNRWEVNKFFKTAFACSPFIMILFGIVLSIQKPRTNFTAGIGLSIMVIFLYYLLIKAGQTLGYNNVLHPFISIWTVNFIFLSLGIFLFIKSRT